MSEMTPAKWHLIRFPGGKESAEYSSGSGDAILLRNQTGTKVYRVEIQVWEMRDIALSASTFKELLQLLDIR